MKTDPATLMVAQFMYKRLGAFLAENKKALAAVMAPGDSTSARYDLDGQEIPLGKITRTEPRPAWKITDPEALLAWAEKNMPDLTETRTVLAEGPVKDLMTLVKTQNGAFTSEGEVIPGITWDNSGGSYMKLTPAKDVEQKVALLAREGRLAALTSGLLGIES